LLFLDISSGELLVILLVAFLVFGPRRVPEMARQAGKWMNEVRRVTSDIRNEIREETRKVTEEFDPMKPTDKEEPS
ncbi:MAG: twin-arginine translocase subunit TatB, partial [Bacteroidales bacterium]|nr:twin-arginine translocase subunit TatB [Bacteroidales bacterium]